MRSKRRTLGLSVSAEAILIVHAPVRAPLKYIEQVLGEKKEWIQKTIARIKARPRTAPKEFVNGESFLFLGNSYPLTLTQDASVPLFFENGFVLDENKKEQAGALLIHFYKKEAKKKISARAEEWAARFDLVFGKIKISSAEKRWGSCSPAGHLNFTWRLILAPLSIIDYVIVHELAHLEHKNHARSFWECVETMYPDYKEAKRWLRQNSGMLKI